MARIQILELPTIYREDGDDEAPYVLVIDEIDTEFHADFWRNLAASNAVEQLGARAILVFEETIEIPANELLPPAQAGEIVRVAEPLMRNDDDREAVRLVRGLHYPCSHRGQTICIECSAYDLQADTTDKAPVAYPCATIKVLDGPQRP